MTQNISRRTLVTALGAAIPVTTVAAVPALAAESVAPRLAALKREHEAAVKVAQVLLAEAETTGAWEAYDEARDLECDIAQAIMAEPVTTPADFALKLAVWEITIRDASDDEDDITEHTGWMDRAMPRLFNDARALLGAPRA